MNNLYVGQHSQYNNEPVFYCKSCLSLGIKTIPINLGLDYCNECSSTDIGQTHIEEWEKLYRERYGFNFLDKN